jgi:N6-adenosine-specific RNA methylase IME4
MTSHKRRAGPVIDTGLGPRSEMLGRPLDSENMAQTGATQDASANQAYGALTESLHIAGYTLERAFRSHLEPLIGGDAWRRCGQGFDDINAFMDSLRLDKFRLIADERRQIVARIKELQPKVTNRQIARTLGVDEGTVRNDAAENSADSRKSVNPVSAAKAASAEKSAPPGLTGAEVAKIARRRESMFSVRERRKEREAELGAKQAALPQKRYGVVYADPAWRWEAWSRVTGLDSAPEAHYPTMTLDAIKALDVAGIAADDSVLFMWATVPVLPQAIETMAAWGFSYKSGLAWAKDRAGTGYWFRNQHELLLFGTRGNPPAPAPGTQASSLIVAPVRGHSRKPDQAYGIIESYFPSLLKIELFCRGPARPSWSAWGNEAQADAESATAGARSAP